MTAAKGKGCETVKAKNKAQEYLEQVERLNTMIENKTAEVMQWREIATSITAHSDSERVQASGSKQKMADALDKVVDLEVEINSMIFSLITLKQNIISTIELLNATEYDVLHKRYIQGMLFEEIGATRRKSKSWATTVHGRALQSVNRILKERDQAKNENL